MKNTYNYYISDFTRPVQNSFHVRRYEFKNFKVYWTYRWSIAEALDKIGSRTLIVANSEMYTTEYSNYALKYKR